MSPNHQRHQKHHHNSSSSHDSSTIRTNSTTCTTAMSTTASPNSHNNLQNNYSSIIYSGSGTGPGGQNSEQSQCEKDNSSQCQQQNLQYLPICDALFNLICLSTYFCDVTFNLLLAYSIYSKSGTLVVDDEEGNDEIPRPHQSVYPIIAFSCIFASLLSTQIISLQWYYSDSAKNSNGTGGGSSVTPIVLILHFCQFGILYRYFKLFTPLDLRHIKSEVRNLIILRLLHGFIQSLPLLICQLVSWLRWVPGGQEPFDDLALIATLFSLFSVSWALSSYTKNIHGQNVHKLVLTWLGVLCQFGWRLGTLGSRTLTFALYTCVYKEWILIVVCLHWGSMLLWLILVDSSTSPGTNGTTVRSGTCNARVQSVNFRQLAILSFIYTFCWVNVDQGMSKSRSRSSIYYATMFLENSLLLGVSWIGMEQNAGVAAIAGELLPVMALYKEWIAGAIVAGFWIGMGFMGLYYQYCHVKKLSLTGAGGTATDNHDHDLEGKGAGAVMFSSSSSSSRFTYEHEIPSRTLPTSITLAPDAHARASPIVVGGLGIGPQSSTPASVLPPPIGPGVFNCRFNPALMKRKKKKPTTFVPPVPPVPESPIGAGGVVGGSSNVNGKMSQAFWKKPLAPVHAHAHQHLHESPYGYTSTPIDAETLKITEWRQRSATATTERNPAHRGPTAEYYEVNSDLDEYHTAYAPRPKSLRSRRGGTGNRPRSRGHGHNSHNHNRSSTSNRRGQTNQALRHCNSESDLESAFGHLGRFTFAPHPQVAQTQPRSTPSHCCTNSDDGDVDSHSGTEAEAELDALYSRITAPVPVLPLPQQPRPKPRTKYPQPETSL